VRLFDCYRGAPIPPGKKSLAYSIAYRAPDRTLTDDEVNALHAGVLERLASRFALEFRA
jgi:phenylalanyl-tRNA synthetase beta chain